MPIDKNTKVVKKIAQKILDNMKIEDNPKYGFIDPITIILIISITLTLIRVIQECRKNRSLIKDRSARGLLLQKDIQEIILKDSWFNRLRLQRIIKQNLTKEQYAAYGKDLQNSLMTVGINLTEDESCALMEAANA